MRFSAVVYVYGLYQVQRRVCVVYRVYCRVLSWCNV